jgi:hypothetical protein
MILAAISITPIQNDRYHFLSWDIFGVSLSATKLLWRNIDPANIGKRRRPAGRVVIVSSLALLSMSDAR